MLYRRVLVPSHRGHVRQPRCKGGHQLSQRGKELLLRLEHVGPGEDFDLNFRDPVEVKDWLLRDPLELAAQKLKKSESQAKSFSNLKNQINSYIESSWQSALASEMAQQ